MSAAELLRVLPWPDWAALLGYFAAWIVYARFARHRSQRDGSLLATTNHYRQLWMRQATLRDNRVIDGVVGQNITVRPSLAHASTCLFVGGLLALLGTADKDNDL
ncbi:MAG: DUF599 family protein, partial [Betaproteobacteria bacterium]